MIFAIQLIFKMLLHLGLKKLIISPGLLLPLHANIEGKHVLHKIFYNDLILVYLGEVSNFYITDILERTLICIVDT